MRVALFITCFNDTLFPATGRATVEVLERLGHEVVFPEVQTCCGQMHFNTGYQREAIPLVSSLPGRLAGWTAVRDLKSVPMRSFREWWKEERG